MTTLRDAPAYRLHRVHRLLRANLLRLLAPFGLTPEQYFILMRLEGGGERPQGELGDSHLDDRGSVSRQVTAMERAGWLGRRPDPDDERTLMVSLSPAGAELVAALLPVVARERDRLFGSVSPIDLAVLHRVFDHLEALLTDEG
jgi:DNA-binding MarR family transcriptional regulator